MSDFIVTEKAMRPALPDRACFYCQQPIGETHSDDCVLIEKKVKVRMTVEYEVLVPHDWDKEAVEFHRNGSSWCCNNVFKELEALQGCLCEYTYFECLDASGVARLDES